MITRRDFLKSLAKGVAAVVASAVIADTAVSSQAAKKTITTIKSADIKSAELKITDGTVTIDLLNEDAVWTRLTPHTHSISNLVNVDVGEHHHLHPITSNDWTHCILTPTEDRNVLVYNLPPPTG